MKILVAYFSASGITKEVAQSIASVVEAKSYEILPQEPYTREDLDWRDENSRTTLECKDKASRPKIANLKDITPFDVIFIGFPIWWYSAPPIIFTFLESQNFDGKIIIPFCTSGGSDLSNAPREMQKIATGADFKQGRLLRFGESKASIKKWINTLGIGEF
ncbi:flavodoxin [Helicobacter sp. MIT 11-5569]|uniref:flavodoxin n=1 Tax=Helicobacter sp. MIT 11-5569 TaxID=1548151 RepID=UPI0009DD6AB7|nr:flavodoxin [Helicobacter sp. MIT 11-5569]TLD84385.1 flavodoxin [Helicobacter sp. MIT 11-5569]